MRFTDHNKEYYLILASDLERDGMAMELNAAGESKVLAEVVYADATGEFTITLFEKSLPLSVVEQLIGMAKIGLVPADRLHDK